MGVKEKSEFMKNLEKRMEEQRQLKSKERKTNLKSNKSNNQFMEKFVIYILAAIFGAFVFAGALAFGAFAWGFIFFKFWGWFVLPVFTTLPVINIFQSIGLAIFLGLFKNQVYPIAKEEYRDQTTTNIVQFFSPFITFVVGWLIYYFLVMPYAG